jgi:hypothetical protein
LKYLTKIDNWAGPEKIVGEKLKRGSYDTGS